MLLCSCTIRSAEIYERNIGTTKVQSFRKFVQGDFLRAIAINKIRARAYFPGSKKIIFKYFYLILIFHRKAIIKRVLNYIRMYLALRNSYRFCHIILTRKSAIFEARLILPKFALITARLIFGECLIFAKKTISTLI